MSMGHPSVARELELLQAGAVLVIGDIVLDRYIDGSVSRISPEAPVPVLLEQSERTVLGGAANVAANIASVGAQAVLVGRVGTDADGDEIARLLEAAGVEAHLIRTPDCPTTQKMRVLSGKQQLVRIDREVRRPTSRDEQEQTLRTVERFLAGCERRAIVLADYAKGFLTDDVLKLVIEAAHHADAPVVTDPKSRHVSRYAGSTVLKPNLLEAMDACGIPETGPDRDTQLIGLADAVRLASGAENVLLSCSDEGAVVAGADASKSIRLPSHAREVADVSGAGDTLVALTALGLAAAIPLSRSAEIANSAAGIVCGKVGTATLSPTELLILLTTSVGEGGPATGRKILSGVQEASLIGRQYLVEGRSLVLTNGCFDLLHAGHVHLLQGARAQGDALMVALNSDTSIRRLKGAARPIQSELDRCRIMAAMECVDYVVLFEEDTPLELIQKVRPSVLIKGDDYQVDTIAGATDVLAFGGRVITIPRIQGRSTTSLVERSQR